MYAAGTGMDPKHIWIVDDNAPDVFLAEMAFQKSGLPLRLTVTSDGEQAIRMISEFQARNSLRPDLVLLDLNLPKIDGIDILRAIRTASGLRQVKIVVLSSSPVSGRREEIDRLGVDLYLQKAFRLEEYCEELVTMVRGFFPPN